METSTGRKVAIINGGPVNVTESAPGPNGQTVKVEHNYYDKRGNFRRRTHYAKDGADALRIGREVLRGGSFTVLKLRIDPAFDAPSPWADVIPADERALCWTITTTEPCRPIDTDTPEPRSARA